MMDIRFGRRMSVCALALLFVITTVSCGSNNEPDVSATPEPTAAITLSSDPTSNAETDDDGIVRSAIKVSGNGAGWVWDRISGAGSWIWDGVSGTGGWMWDRVTGLPGDISDIITRFWRWFRGTGVGEAAAEVVESVQLIAERVGSFSFSGFLWGLVKFVLYVVVTVVALKLSFLAFHAYWANQGRKRFVHGVGNIARKWNVRGRNPSSSHTKEKPGPSRSKEDWAQSALIANDRVQSGPTVNVYVGRTSAIDDQMVLVQSSGNLAPFRTIPGSDWSWSKEHVAEVRRRSTNETISTLFGLAAERDGKPVGHNELMAHTRRTSIQVLSDLAAFSLLCRSVHPDGSRPIEEVAPNDGDSNRAYSVQRQYLNWWFDE